ncbi:30S ribosomal protein S8 [Candidatus Hodgkinia cicadicola]|uniref:Small ribosomal subunit protein uS8 n=1 Tax=Candidatus Hodgkinia cicadicola TaxID=573658 RepID=A0ABX4MID2_9HYPH|nr:30S ribosomal protein S8 [Candidatus Hodgkinia cicadicola]PIM96499.1 30S ribosomal protein S8 [Candidatus Hodgkinia cicadicola]
MIGSVANMLAHVKNCSKARKVLIYIPYSKFKFNLLLAFERYGFVKRVSLLRYSTNRSEILIELAYNGYYNMIQDIVQVSKPGQRIYWKKKQLRVKHQIGTYFLSTSNGIKTNLDSTCVGGEVICNLV